MNFEIINKIFHGNLNKILLFIEFKFYTLTFNSFDLLLLSAAHPDISFWSQGKSLMALKFLLAKP